ncbi:hypothetical protein N2Q22_00980, partial [Escherichia coli]
MMNTEGNNGTQPTGLSNVIYIGYGGVVCAKLT